MKAINLNLNMENSTFWMKTERKLEYAPRVLPQRWIEGKM